MGTWWCNIWGDDDNGDGWVDASGANPLWHVLNLQEADPNFVEHWDNVGKVPYVWNEQRSTFLSFENEASIRERAKFIEEKNLGGALIWVMNGDYSPNPNYDPTYDPTTADRNDPNFNIADLNKGKYTFGDTLTETLKAEMDRMGPAKKTVNPWDTLTTTNVEVVMDVKYDHPNGTYTFDVVNNTGEKIPGGWEIAFDFPKSADFTSCWGGTHTSVPNGDFNHITIKGGAWNALDPGAKIQIQGMTKLCFSGIQNITFNGLKPINWATGNEGVQKVPPLKGTVSVVPSTVTLANYDVVAEIPAASKATSYEIYENNKVVQSGVVDPAAAAQTINYTVVDQVPGVYSYRLDLINADGVTASNVVKHEVPAPKELATATASTATPVTNTGAYDVTVTIPAESQATAYTVFENGTPVQTGAVDPDATVTTVFTVNKVDQPVGKYTYTVELTNATAKTTLSPLVVEVVEKQVDPLLIATVATSTASTDTCAYDVTVTIPANSQAISYEVYENDVVIKTGQVDPTAQGVTVDTIAKADQAVGTYAYKVVLTNGKEVTTSNTATVEVVEKQVDPLLTATVATVVVEEEVVVNTPPVIEGVKDAVIKVGDAFDPMAGVTAMDAEDGDLTGAIKVEGTVDTAVAGNYTLTYTVADKEGLTATASCTVTVEQKEDPNNTYDPTKVYNTGDKVIYNGQEYTAKWWTQGETPGSAAVWELYVPSNPDGSKPHTPGTAYVGGDIVEYNGSLYKAKWWTNTTPGSDDSWELVK